MSGQQQIQSEGAFDASVRRAINTNFNTLFGAVVAVGTVYFLDPANGSDGNDGLSSGAAKQTLNAAYSLCTAGKNDTVVLIGDGATTGTARVNAAFTWSKNATHLMGFCSPVLFSQRARIAPTATTTAFTPFFTISANGCIFQNIQWFHGFNTGTTSQINMVLTGSRNYFANCAIDGMGDNESAQSAGSRSLKIGSGGSGENYFTNCSIGVDTITRTQANASLEFAGATPRNYFNRCVFPFMGSSAGVLGILGTGADCLDRVNTFDNCLFLNAIKSSSTTMTVLTSLTNAATGGALMFKQCVLLGIGEYGDTIALANSYIDGFTGAAATSGIAVNPS